MTRPADNPFRISRIHALRYRFDSGTLTQVLARFHQLGHRACLLGRHGTGKSTLLNEISEHLASAGWECRHLVLRSEHRCPSTDEQRRWLHAPHQGLLLTLDGLEQLNPLRRWNLLRQTHQAGGLLVTSHQPCRLPVLHRHTSNPEVLHELITELAGPIAIDHEDLHRRHHGDIRACLFECYDRWASGTLTAAST